MKRLPAAVLASVATAALLALPASGGHGHSGSKGRTVIEADTMAAVDGAFVGSANPIRGINGGGLPWQIDEAEVELSSNGRIEVEVDDLVLLEAAPVPPDRQGTNPAPNFVAVVSCLTTVDGVATTVNVATDPFPASTRGDSRIRDRIDLPDECIAPIVFVGPNATTWFAATGVG
ncbi:hypothetical protein [Jiangella alkaliphila]|uniref:Uncharacterized protein n=1 Tax=Jiangella alkaliphila TaxID=419479 RepID=A0A1H2LGD5_9ACTN|nr:hypothetical protein [Jiangella alkaliphila]SDU80077.1 hypothetical protein SAMN04488563_6114 [Jiangella alkaliphila]